MKKEIWIVVISAIAVIVAIFLVYQQKNNSSSYNPSIIPSEFTIIIDNPYFELTVGKKLVYESTTEDGIERVDILVPGWKREVMGVETLVYWDHVYLDGVLIEDTRDYLAQHVQTGDVWYFGEHVDNYESGILVDHDGAWLGGVDGALPGRWILGEPNPGDYFRNEYYKGKAEDESEVAGLNQRVTVPFGTFTDCVMHLDSSPLFPEKAYKYYCKDEKVKGAVLEIEPAGDSNPKMVQLISVEMTDVSDLVIPSSYIAEGVYI